MAEERIYIEDYDDQRIIVKALFYYAMFSEITNVEKEEIMNMVEYLTEERIMERYFTRLSDTIKINK